MLKRIRDALAASPLLYGGYLQRRHPKFTGEFPEFEQANCPLRTEADLKLALADAERIGVPLHPDRPKNWDFLTALTLTLRKVTNKTSPILDAGGGGNSAYLKSLYLYGYRDLNAVNLEFTRKFRRGRIRFHPGDITATSFPENSFGAIFCQSVIEHGVSPQPFFQEMSRVCRDDALLIVSTDYWNPRLATGDFHAYGAKVKVFDRSDISDWINVAGRSGWQTTSEPRFECDEKVVRWQRLNLDFTFFTLVFRRS